MEDVHVVGEKKLQEMAVKKQAIRLVANFRHLTVTEVHRLGRGHREARPLNLEIPRV